MSNTIGDTKDLDVSRREALQGLLGSMGHAVGNPSSTAKLSAEQVQKLSEKIKEILGDDEYRSPERDGQPNQLRNEGDLPIVDITEPVNGDSQAGTPSAYISEARLIPWSLLPPDEKERRRQERDHVLDLLEEEERLLQLKEQRDAEEERKEAIRNRKESAKAELAHLKAARELQTKMGQALIQNSKGMGDGKRGDDARSNPQLKASSVAKKCLSSTDVPAMEGDERDQHISVRQPEWGFVIPGRLRARNRIPLVSAAGVQKYPTKMHVVERHPTATFNIPPHLDADSDDESTSTENLSPHAGSDPLNEEDDSSSSDGHLSDNELLEEVFDYDAAQHHREIAQEYHKKRHAIGVGTAKASATHDPDNELPKSFIRRLPLSRFRADHMAAAYDKSHASNPVSTSVGQTVIPTSRQKSLRSSVRLGKLEDDQLVGAESGESGSEDEAVRQMIQMLRTGNIENVGPNFQPSTVSPLGTTTAEMSGVTRGVNQSRFKLVRGCRNTKRTQDDQSRDNVRSQPVISSVIERKAPKSSPSQRFLINKPPSRLPVSNSEPLPMVIHSPSFPMISTVAITSSPVTTSGIPLPNRTQAGYSSSDKPSAVPDSTAPSQASSHDSLSTEKLTG